MKTLLYRLLRAGSCEELKITCASSRISHAARPRKPHTVYWGLGNGGQQSRVPTHSHSAQRVGYTDYHREQTANSEVQFVCLFVVVVVVAVVVVVVVVSNGCCREQSHKEQ